jgi:shikimate kinase
MLIGRDGKGKTVVNELKSGTPGQTFIDPDDGEVKTDTGVPVADIEKEQKVIDLQAKKG